MGTVADLKKLGANLAKHPLVIVLVSVVVTALIGDHLKREITNESWHTHLEFGEPTLVPNKGAHPHFHKNDVPAAKVTLTNIKREIPAQAVFVYAGAAIMREGTAGEALPLARTRLGHRNVGTLYEGTLITTQPMEPLTAKGADSLNIGKQVFCMVAYARWGDDTGGYETDLSECLEPNGTGDGSLHWLPGWENNLETKTPE